MLIRILFDLIYCLHTSKPSVAKKVLIGNMMPKHTVNYQPAYTAYSIEIIAYVVSDITLASLVLFP